MTGKFGWCAGPVGSKGDHGSCKYEMGAGDSILRCSCDCHEASEVSVRRGRIEQADEVRQHPIGSDRPTRITEQRG